MSYGKVKETFWTDELGRSFKVPATGKRLRPCANSAHAALRAFVFRRDRFSCRLCGATPSSVPENYDGTTSMFSWCGCGGGLKVDHIIPRSKGGSNHPTNLQTLCMSCNSGKCTRFPEAA